MRADVLTDAFGWLVFLWRLGAVVAVTTALLIVIGDRRRNRLADRVFPFPPYLSDAPSSDQKETRRG